MPRFGSIVDCLTAGDGAVTIVSGIDCTAFVLLLAPSFGGCEVWADAMLVTSPMRIDKYLRLCVSVMPPH